ncbi:MAG: hypothetical protein EZS28_000211 [Streblomastix strix]|uniref:Uncharacterized protein n=1 Tax=Streblomastix strix TaxID=222440 RepID=A0A5J4XAW5_9EUKA|nr:MAG: hypothetical protein EZS28_000211 [Streblomastix strix]
MGIKKQQARPALKNKPKNVRQQQNRRQHQPQAHKKRLKDNKQPIIQPEPVVQYIPKPNHQQAAYKQVPRAIPKDFVKQQQTAKQTVQNQAPRALQPVRYDLLSQVVEDKRANFKDDQIEYAGGDQQTAVTITFFNNNITSPGDCDAFIERVYQHENGRLFKCGFDFGTVIQRSEVIIEPNYIGKDMIEALYPGRTRYKPYKRTSLSKYRTPMEDPNAHNRDSEYKATQYYKTFRFQTELQKIRGYQYPILGPTAVASTIKAKNYIKTILIDKSQVNFVDKWLVQVFIEALQIRDDNKYADNVHQRYEAHCIGFDCLKSATTLIFKNIKSSKYEIIDRPGTTCCPIHLIVKSTDNSIHLKFIDAKNYVSANIELDDFLMDIGEVELSDDIIRQSLLLLSAIDNRINDYIPFNIDLLQNTSLAKLSCLKQYAFANKNFNISSWSNPIDNTKPYDLSQEYWKSKARFTYDNQQTLDRIDNIKSHIKSNVLPCCLYCDNLPMTISNQEVYDSLRNDMVDGNSFDIHRENIAEKYKDFRLCNKKNISENCFIVELEKKRCSCSTPLQVAYFTMDNSNDTDSLCLAIIHESWPIKDKKLWDELYQQLFPSANNDNYYDKKKILSWNIESESTTCLALAPKCYYMENQRSTLADIISEHFKKLHGKSPDEIQDIPPDYQIKLLSKLNRPYFSPQLGSWEIYLEFSMNERIIRANQIYLFCININTKYLVVFPLRDKLSVQEVMVRRDSMEVS